MILFEKCGLKIEQAGDEIIFSGRANINITDKETFGEIARSISKFEPPIFNRFKNIGKRSQEAMKIGRFNPPTREEFEARLAFSKSIDDLRQIAKLEGETYKKDHPEEFEDD